MFAYIKTILISFDQFIGSFIPGAYADESISSRAFREQWAIESFINIILEIQNIVKIAIGLNLIIVKTSRGDNGILSCKCR